MNVKELKYLYIIEKGKRNYSAYVPDLPGCVSTGKTISVTKRMIQEAIEFHIEGMLLDGEKLPKPTIDSTGFLKLTRIINLIKNEETLHPA